MANKKKQLQALQAEQAAMEKDYQEIADYYKSGDHCRGFYANTSKCGWQTEDVLLKCLRNENDGDVQWWGIQNGKGKTNKWNAYDGESKNEAQWLKRIKIIFAKMDDENEWEPEQESIYNLGYNIPYTSDGAGLLFDKEKHKGKDKYTGTPLTRGNTVLGCIIGWKKEHKKIKDYLLDKLDLYHVMPSGELYMNVSAVKHKDLGGEKVYAYGKFKDYKLQGLPTVEGTALFYAVVMGKDKMVKLLLEKGAKTIDGKYRDKYLIKDHLVNKPSLPEERIRCWKDQIGSKWLEDTAMYRKTPTEMNNFFIEHPTDEIYSGNPSDIKTRRKNIKELLVYAGISKPNPCKGACIGPALKPSMDLNQFLQLKF